MADPERRLHGHGHRLDAPNRRLLDRRGRGQASRRLARSCVRARRRRRPGCTRAAAGSRRAAASSCATKTAARPVVTPGPTGPPSVPRKVISRRPLRSASRPRDDLAAARAGELPVRRRHRRPAPEPTGRRPGCRRGGRRTPGRRMRSRERSRRRPRRRAGPAGAGSRQPPEEERGQRAGGEQQGGAGGCERRRDLALLLHVPDARAQLVVDRAQLRRRRRGVEAPARRCGDPPQGRRRPAAPSRASVKPSSSTTSTTPFAVPKATV